MKTPIITYKKHTYLLYLALLFGMASCGFLGTDTKDKIMDTADKDSKAMQASKKTSQSTGYVVKPNLDHPKFKELSEAFDKEEHRFEIDACEFKYNGQSFFIGDPMEKIIKIFGEPDGEIIETFDGKSKYCDYVKFKLSFSFTTKTNIMRKFSIKMSNYLGEHDNTVFDIIKFRKIPYQLDMTLNEFMELSDMNHDNVGHSSADFHIKDEQRCKGFEDTKTRTSIGSNPSYETTSSGHFTFQGDFNPKSTGVIESFFISKK